MAKNLSEILVVDLECTCWDSNAGHKPPPGEVQEIIEVGIAVLDVKTRQRTAKESIIVKPQYSTISPFCTQLTTLTQKDVDAGIPLVDACKIISTKYNAREKVWASYGEFDRKHFTKECTAKGLEYPFGFNHINVKNWAALKYKLQKEYGMDRMLEFLKIPLEGTHHRGVDDAWNIALILASILGA
jgi:inhibitor of KinA sporulation pathway (predicted exonuclease)